MKEMVTIKAEIRTDMNSRVNNRLRKAGYLPGSIFGKKLEPVSIAISRIELEKLLKSQGRNAVFKIVVVGANEYTVMVKDIHNHPLTNEVLNVGFQQISLSEKIKTNVAIKIIGVEAIESKKLVALLQMDVISVKGLPQDIPDAIEVDIAKLGAGENITVGELQLPQGIEAEDDPEQLVVSVNEPKRQEVEESTEGEAETGSEAKEE